MSGYGNIFSLALHLLLIYYKENDSDTKNKIQTRGLDSLIGSD